MDLEKNLAEYNLEFDSRPLIFDLQNQSDQKKLQELFAADKIKSVVDDYKEQVHELFAIKNPTLVYTPDFEEKFEEYFAQIKTQSSLWQQGKWVYFPWLFSVVHIL